MTAATSASPYKGLFAFEESDADRFFGRAIESEELLACVRSGRLTTLFGRSGLGKTSLLQAGLFPRLREAGYLPVSIRIGQLFQHDHQRRVAEGGEKRRPSPVEIVHEALSDQEESWDVTITPPRLGDDCPDGPAETLWSYFHRLPVRAPGLRAAIPVVVLDQFEEVLEALPSSEAARQFIEELADLVEERVPVRVREAVERAERNAGKDAEDPEQRLPARTRKAHVAVVLGVREDYLPQLEDLQHHIPSIFESRYRLLPLDGTQAFHAVYEPVKDSGVLEPDVAEDIVRYVSAQGPGRRGRGASADLADLDCEPVLLSFVCDELMKRRGDEPISTQMLQEEQRDLLRAFYEKSFEPPEDDGSVEGFEPQALRHFVEDHLLTKDGRRTPYDLTTATKLAGVNKGALDVLIDRHLLRRFNWQGNNLVELIHDRVADVVRESRDARQERVAKEKREAAAQAEQVRREAEAEAERRRLSEEARREKEQREQTEALAKARMGRLYLLLTLLVTGLVGLGLFLLYVSSKEKQVARQNEELLEAQEREAEAARSIEAKNEELVAANTRLEANQAELQRAAASERAIAEKLSAKNVDLAAREQELKTQKEQLEAHNKRLRAARLTLLSQDFEDDAGISFLLARDAAAARMEKHSWTQLHRSMDLCAEYAVLRGHEGPVLACAIQQGEPEYAATATPLTLRLWKLPDTLVRDFPGPVGEPSAVGLALSRSGRVLAGAWRGSSELRFYAWSVEGAPELQVDAVRVKDVDEILAWGFDGDDAPLAVIARQHDDLRSVSVIDLRRARETHLSTVDMAPQDGQLPPTEIRASVSGSGRYIVLNEGTGVEVFTPAGESRLRLDKTVFQAAFDGSETDRLLILHEQGMSSITLDAEGEIAASQEDEDILVTRSVGDLFRFNPYIDGATVRLWDATHYEQPSRSPDGAWWFPFGPDGRRLQGHRGFVRDAAISSDHAWVMTASEDRTARIWRATPGELPALRDSISDVAEVVWAPDGQQVAYLLKGGKGQPETIRVMDDSGAFVAAVRSKWGPITRMAFRPDSLELLLGSNAGDICLWSLEEGKLSIPATRVETGAIIDLAWGPRGNWAIASSKGGEVVVLDADSGLELGRYGGADAQLPPLALATSSEYPLLACYDAGPPLPPPSDIMPAPAAAPAETAPAVAPAPAPAPPPILEAPLLLALPRLDPAQVFELEGHEDPLLQLVFSDAGDELMTLSADRLRTWRVGESPKATTPDLDEDIRGRHVVGAWFSPGGIRAICQPPGADTRMVDLDFRVRAELRTHRNVSGLETWGNVLAGPCDPGVPGEFSMPQLAPSLIAVTSGGEFLIVQLASNSVAVADYTGRVLFTLPRPPGCGDEPNVVELRPSPDSEVIVVLYGGTVRAWHLGSEDLLAEAANYLHRTLTEEETRRIRTSMPEYEEADGD